jgi:phage gp29-like protein
MTRPVKTAAPAQGVLPKPQPEAEVGVSLHLPFVAPYKSAWEILRDDEVTVRALQAMRKTDGQARALYRLITLPIRAALKTATFVPEQNVEGGEDEAKFIEQMLTLPASAGGMMVPFNQVISQLLMAIFDGFSAFEMVYWTPKKGPLKGKWTLKKIAHRPSDTLTFLLDRNGEFVGLRQRTMFQGREIDETIPGEHVIRYAANEEERPFYGESYFQSAYYHWDKKFKLYVIAHLACQRAAVGTRVGKMPANPTREEKLAFQKSLADLGVAQWMTIPETYAVESLKEGPNFDFLAYINHHNSQMSKSVLASFFDKEQGGGDSGKLVDFGQQSDALFLLMLQTIMSEIESVINDQVIPRFIDWNFSSGKYPTFQFGSLSQEQKAAIVDVFRQLAVAGQSLTIRPEFIHELEKVVAEEFGLEVDWETVEEEMAAEKEVMAAQQEMDQAAKEMEFASQQIEFEQQAIAAQNPAPAGPADGGAMAPPQVDPSLVPEGFTLLTADDDATFVSLTTLAQDLLGEAYTELTGQELELARGPLKGPRKVRTASGAKYYGEPIGSTILWNKESATGAAGVQGKVFGGGIRGPQGQKSTGGGPGAASGRQTHGGGPGAPAQNPGSVVTDPTSAAGTASKDAKPQRFFGHPDAPGAVLIDFGDGTVAIRDGNGNVSPRQRFDITKFADLGWTVSRGADVKPRPATADDEADNTKRRKGAK